MTSAPPPSTPPAWAPPPPPPPPPGTPPAFQPRAQLRRSRTDKVLGGVSGGLAEYSGIDALLWRVGFVALALAGGTGVIVYLLLWLLMPAEPVGSVPGATVARRERPPAGPRSPIARITMASLLVVVGLLALADRFTPLDPAAPAYLGSALLVVGLGLVAAAFSPGRTARGGLIALGAVLSVALIAASTGPWDDHRGGMGDVTFRPLTADDVQPVYRGGMGDMTLDLSRIDVSDLDEPIVTRVEHGLGDLEVIVPRSADVEMTVDIGLGSVDALGQESSGDGFFPGQGRGDWVDDDEAELDLTVNSGLGDVEVRRG
jgi:phage shock protein PspC (stress-responsive transcriptional regulator)